MKTKKITLTTNFLLAAAFVAVNSVMTFMIQDTYGLDMDKQPSTYETEVVAAMSDNIVEPVSIEIKEAYKKLEPIETKEVIEPEPEPVIEPEVEVDPHDVELLACVIYQEAGADYICDDCRRRVADVVLNRVDSEYFPNTIEEVLTAPNQYGRFSWTGVVWPERASYDSEAHAVDRAYRIAEEVLKGQHSELYGNGYIWQAEFSQGVDNIYCCGIYFGRN